MYARTLSGLVCVLAAAGAPSMRGATLIAAGYEQFVVNCSSSINLGTPTCGPTNPADPSFQGTPDTVSLRGDGFDIAAATSASTLGSAAIVLNVTGGGNYPYGTATLTYQFEIIGPVSGPIALTVDANGTMTTTGDGNGYAFLTLATDPSDTDFPGGIFFDPNAGFYSSYTASACSAVDTSLAPTGVCNAGGNNDFPLAATIQVVPNQIVDVTLSAFGAMGNFGLCNANGPGCGSASFAVDPQYIPDPNYSIIYSPGIFLGAAPPPTGGIPEPSAALLLGAGLFGLWLRRRAQAH